MCIYKETGRSTNVIHSTVFSFKTSVYCTKLSGLLTSVSTTAVLLFNYSEKQKASLKKIAPRIGDKKLNDLIHQLNKKAKKIVKASGAAFYQVNATGDKDFGEQLYEAYQQLFEQGYNSVIGISNDCPDLTSYDLLLATKELQQKELILGPAKDGGLYLFGLTKGTISKEEFLQLSWQNASLQESILQLTNSRELNAALLVEKSDMDTVGEFYKAFRSHHQFLIDFKNQLFSYCKRRFKAVKTVITSIQLRTLSLRAPPALV